MCGILGIVHRQPTGKGWLTQADLARLAHRGPDAGGLYSDDRASLGHRRLAIVDLSDDGLQPMSSDDGRYVVVFNGEIYNYVELRAELAALGETFHSQSDTEVLLKAYKIWGRDCVTRFRGMFAFAIWDTCCHEIFLARDRCGEKPLFYHITGGRIVFASELKALLPLLDERPELDLSAVDMYLHYQYVPEPWTLLEGVRKLPAAHTLLMSPASWQSEPKRYWDLEDVGDTTSLPTSTPEILERIRECLEDSVRITLRADVPVAVALSGGIDSGAIAALAQRNYREPMHAFSVGYPGRPAYDERHQAQALAKSLGMQFHEVELSIPSATDFFQKLVRIMDEPIADPAAFAHYSVPKAAADLGIKVLLSGIGGDEIFWGYEWVRKSAVNNEIAAARPSVAALSHLARRPGVDRLLKKISRSALIPSTVRDWASVLRELSDPHTPAGQMHFYTGARDFSDAFSLKRAYYTGAIADLPSDRPFQPTDIGPRSLDKIPVAITRMLFDTWLTSNALTLGDRVSMSVGVETRLPFLDVKLVELVSALRTRTPDHHLGQKAWLRAALKGILPDEVLTRPKAGFQPPVREWLSALASQNWELLVDGALTDQSIIRRSQVLASRPGFSGEKMRDIFFAYKLILLECWYREVVINAK